MTAFARASKITPSALYGWLKNPPQPPTTVFEKVMKHKTLGALKKLSDFLGMASHLSLFEGPYKEEVPDIKEVVPAPLERHLTAPQTTTALTPVMDMHKALEKALFVLEGVSDLKKKMSQTQLMERFEQVYELYTLADRDMEAVKIIMDHLAGKE